MTPAPVIRLHPDDGVLIARSSLPPGMVVADGVTTAERIPAGHFGYMMIGRSFTGYDPRRGKSFVLQTIDGGGWGGRR